MKLKTIFQFIRQSYFQQTEPSKYGVEWFAEENDEFLLISFRGTKLTGNQWYYDIYRNLIAPLPWYYSDVGWVSLGYINGCLDVIDDIDQFIKQRNATKPIIMCGHSLGAALSFLTGLILHDRGYNIHTWVGAGTVNCMLSRNTEIPFKCYNYKYEEDIVATYPPRWLGFIPPVEPYHIGKDDSSITHIGDLNDHRLVNYIEYAPDVDINS